MDISHPDLRKLLLQIAEGDEKAFFILYAQFAPGLRNYVFRMLRSQSDGEEVIQEIFIRVWLYRDKLPEIENVTAWIFTVTARQCLQYLRKKANDQKKAAHWTPPADPSTPAQLLDTSEIMRLVQKALQSLPDKTALIYQLNREKGLTTAEIAVRLNISPGTVKNQLTAANRHIREALLNKGIGLPLLIAMVTKIF